MNEEYSAYLNSPAWQKKREQRLAMTGGRCSACVETESIHVHHLTYARIFNEDMADLLPLCEAHHKSAEQFIAAGVLHRWGDVLFLASETLRLILGRRQPKKKRATRTGARNQTQAQLLADPQFQVVGYFRFMLDNTQQFGILSA